MSRLDTSRDQRIVALLESGASLDAIAEIFGVSRERVRQILQRIGHRRTAVVQRRNGVDPLIICRAADTSRSAYDIARKTGYSSAAVRRVLNALGKTCGLSRPLLTRTALLADLQRMAGELGHTPRVQDIKRFSQHSLTTYSNYFGSLGKAQHEAGLIPNGRGRPRRKETP